MKARALIRSLLILLFATSSASRAQAYCLEGEFTPPSGLDKWVYLVAPNDTFLNFDTQEAAHMVAVAVDNWNEEGGADLRVRFGGIVSSAQYGAVNIHESSSCTRCGGDAPACEKTVIDQFLGRYMSNIYFERSSPAPGVDECQANGVERSLFEFYRGVQHEVGHAWGLEDEYFKNDRYYCEGKAWDSVMNRSDFITRRDHGALTSLYGVRNENYMYKESGNTALSWSSTPSLSDVKGPLRLGSIGTVANGFIEIIAVAGLSSTFKVFRGFHNSTHQSFTPVGSPVGRTWDVASAARKNNNKFAAAARAYESELDASKTINVFFTSDKGVSWTGKTVTLPDGEVYAGKGEGVSLAYDPVQDVYIVGFVTHQNIHTQTFDADPPYEAHTSVQHVYMPPLENYALVGFPGEEYATPVVIKSIDYPVIACNSVVVAGEDNCMMAWASLTNPYFRIRHVLGRIDPTTKAFILNPALSGTRYRGWQSPSIAATDSQTYPFVLAFKQHNTIYTIRYSAAEQQFVNERQAVTESGSGLLMGAIGRISGGTLILRYQRAE